MGPGRERDQLPARSFQLLASIATLDARTAPSGSAAPPPTRAGTPVAARKFATRAAAAGAEPAGCWCRATAAGRASGRSASGHRGRTRSRPGRGADRTRRGSAIDVRSWPSAQCPAATGALADPDRVAADGAGVLRRPHATRHGGRRLGPRHPPGGRYRPACPAPDPHAVRRIPPGSHLAERSEVGIWTKWSLSAACRRTSGTGSRRSSPTSSPGSRSAPTPRRPARSCTPSRAATGTGSARPTA